MRVKRSVIYDAARPYMLRNVSKSSLYSMRCFIGSEISHSYVSPSLWFFDTEDSELCLFCGDGRMLRDMCAARGILPNMLLLLLQYVSTCAHIPSL